MSDGMTRRQWLVFANHYRTRFGLTDAQNRDRPDWYYVRVVQANEQYTWSSPIWVGDPG